MCSCATFIEPSFSTEIDIPASVCCRVAIPLLFSIQFLVQPCSCPIGSLDPLSPVSGSYGRVLRCLWQSREEASHYLGILPSHITLDLTGPHAHSVPISPRTGARLHSSRFFSTRSSTRVLICQERKSTRGSKGVDCRAKVVLPES